MIVARVVDRTRASVLQVAFELLYTRLGFLHETVGRIVFGAAWHGRRRHVVPARQSGLLLDIGSGEGRLLSTLLDGETQSLGLEPSPVMARRARRHRVQVIRATAQAMPIRSGTVHQVIATYPGPWIVDPRTWDEIARVTTPGGSVRILLGGVITRGRGAAIRGRLLRLAYGGDTMSIDRMPALGNNRVAGAYATIEDAWGTALIWSGTRVE